MGHARSLLSLSDGEAMVRLADEVISNGWSVRRLEEEVRTAQQASLEPAAAPPKAAPAAKGRPAWLNELEENLRDAMGAPVSIKYGRKRSQIVIECATKDELDRLYRKLTQ